MNHLNVHNKPSQKIQSAPKVSPKTAQNHKPRPIPKIKEIGNQISTMPLDDIGSDMAGNKNKSGSTPMGPKPKQPPPLKNNDIIYNHPNHNDNQHQHKHQHHHHQHHNHHNHNHNHNRNHNQLLIDEQQSKPRAIPFI